MKKCVIALATIFAFVAPSLFGQSQQINLFETILLYNFEEGDKKWEAYTEDPDFITNEIINKETGIKVKYPIVKSYSNVPRQMGKNRASSTNCLGISVSWIKKGYNYFDVRVKESVLSNIRSGSDASMKERGDVVIPGQVQSFAVWVWGGMFNYRLELHVDDYKGFHHILDLGTLRYRGWRNLRVDVPKHIPQTEEQAPRVKGLTFTYFRIWSEPLARKDRFHIFFDYFKCVSDIYGLQYDGVELEKELRKDIGSTIEMEDLN